jgi:hypothetical protein
MEGNTVAKGTIGWAINMLKIGHRLRRKGWNGIKLFVVYVPAGALTIPNKFGDGYRTGDQLVLRTTEDTLVPWACPVSDLLASDWEVVPGSGGGL